MNCCCEKCRSELQEALKAGFILHRMVEHKTIGFGEPKIPEGGKN